MLFATCATDVLWSVMNVTNRVEEDGIDVPVSRSDVFEEAFEGERWSDQRAWFNTQLRTLRDEGLVELTRTTVSLTQLGFESVWE